jgi:hypothetical protein
MNALPKGEGGKLIRYRKLQFISTKTRRCYNTTTMNRLHHHRFDSTRMSFLICISLILGYALTAQGQSGRRSSGGSTTNTAPSVSGPKPVEKKTDKAPSIQLLVGIEDPSIMINIPYYLADTILDNCLRHLSDSSEVVVTSAGRGMTRADAIRKAKDEKNRYVVWLQLGSDTIDSGRQSKNGPDELYVSYTIFEPETAKVRQTGRAHHSIYKTGRGGVTAPSRNGSVYSDYALKQAAREAAERILEAFDIKVRDEGWPR